MKQLLKVALLSALSFGAYALSTDSEQPIYIDSDVQTLDMKSNQVTFTGDVKLVQGSIEVEADKVIVFRNAADGSIQRVEAFGDLATFRQETDDGKELKGKAEELYYSMEDDLLTMIKRAELKQDGSIIKGPKIRYKISTETMFADGSSESRVSTVLQPQATEGQ